MSRLNRLGLRPKKRRKSRRPGRTSRRPDQTLSATRVADPGRRQKSGRVAVVGFSLYGDMPPQILDARTWTQKKDGRRERESGKRRERKRKEKVKRIRKRKGKEKRDGR